jgi:HEAT repeat protein
LERGGSRKPLKKANPLARLLDDLRSRRTIDREAAVARLRVLGSRAVPHLAALIESTPDAQTRRAALQALDGIDDPRAIDPAAAAIEDTDVDVAGAAIGVLRGWVTRESGTRVLDALTGVALDRSRDARVRLAALDALSELPRDLVQPILEHAPADSPRTVDDPGAVREWVAAHGEQAPLSELHDAVVRAHDRERADPSARRKQDWLVARGAAHAALARRGSRVALYDLRETFERTTSPLPLDFLTAITLVGDASCLEPLAQAWASSPGEAWWRERLESAAADIVHRTRLSGRSAVVKRIRSKWTGFL